ncbi:hypothetical protein NPIL_657751 [Nephila pilipes]|uniref:Uncharacterized protein n=1 Tax=Nephila pilipes TaxID=299642 RepID=A0A8X6NRX8_NEPPI|nr:hypothetical protein NPIL_657751 [Nephila pilipes]
MPFPETLRERRPAPLETVPTLPAPAETFSEPSPPWKSSPPDPILLKPVETTPFLPCNRKRPLESPLYSIPNKIVKSEPSEESIRLLLKTETIETTQMKPKVGDFVMLYPNHPPKFGGFHWTKPN